MECYIISPALLLLTKHLVSGQHQKAPNFSAFHWSPHGSLVSIGQHFVTTRVLHLPKRTETSLITESDQRASNHQLCSYARPAQPGLIPDQAVWAVHSCNSWLANTYPELPLTNPFFLFLYRRVELYYISRRSVIWEVYSKALRFGVED